MFLCYKKLSKYFENFFFNGLCLWFVESVVKSRKISFFVQIFIVSSLFSATNNMRFFLYFGVMCIGILQILSG